MSIFLYMKITVSAGIWVSTNKVFHVLYITEF